MSVNRLGYVAYVVLLIGYAIYKYSVAAPPVFSQGYAQSVAILVFITAVAPFLIAVTSLKSIRLGLVMHIAAGLLLGLAACVGGYALFWKLFISGTGAEAPAVAEVALRGVGWGLAQGALAAAAAK